MFKTLGLLGMVVLCMVVLFSATAASAAPPKKWYWSEEQADAAVLTRIKIPACYLMMDDRRCANGVYRSDGRPYVGSTPIIEAECRGSDERGSSFTYARFMCRFVTYDANAVGRLILTPTGSVKLRWKLVSIY